MSATNVNTYMEHPLVRDYLRDLDFALSAADPREADEIRLSIREHLASEFAVRDGDDDRSVNEVVSEVLESLGPTDSIISGLDAKESDEMSRTDRRRLHTIEILTAISVVYAPFFLVLSVILSTIALVMLRQVDEGRARTILITINVVLLVALIGLALVGLIMGQGLMESVFF